MYSLAKLVKLGGTKSISSTKAGTEACNEESFINIETSQVKTLELLKVLKVNRDGTETKVRFEPRARPTLIALVGHRGPLMCSSARLQC